MIGLLLLLAVSSLSVAAAQVQFNLHRRGVADQRDLQALPLNYDRTKDTYVLLHGMGGSSQGGCVINLKNALLETQDVNVIVPDYTRAAYFYTLMYSNTAKRISEFLIRNQVNPQTTTVVGMSLGAHIGGILKNYGFKPREMIGMDAAGPHFSIISSNSKLSRASANFVQSVHTNVGELGTAELNGHLDVYINKGTDYPCCTDRMCRHAGACFWTANTIRRGPVAGYSCPSQAMARNGNCTGVALLTGVGAPPLQGRNIAHVSVNTCIPQS